MRFLALLVLAFLPIGKANAVETLSLAGDWRFALDEEDVGKDTEWFARSLPDKIRLPGVLQSQGYGFDISTNTPWVVSLGDAWWKLQPAELRERFSQPANVRVPFLSQPPKHYLGAAWYQRDVEIPANLRGQHFTLFLERVHWRSTVWLDDREIASDMSLGTPHEFDLGMMAPGVHRITVRVDNRTQLPPAGHLVDSHSISDALGATWNGIVGRIELRATAPVWIDELQNFYAASNRVVSVHGRIRNVTDQTVTNTIVLGLTPAMGSANVELGDTFTLVIPPAGRDFESTLARPLIGGGWHEFSPSQYFVTARLGEAGSADESVLTAPIPVREVTARDKDMLINGRPVNLRMTHFGGDFPLTGYPATDVASWKRIIGTCKDYGLNGIRFHSWCPPEAAFQAADEMGFYLQAECGLWADFGNEPTREFLQMETARMIRAYGNHPSFILFSPGNEPRNYTRYLPQWAKENYAKDPRRLYAAGSGWSDPSQVTGGAQFAVLVRYGKGQLRNTTGWLDSDYSVALEGVHMPVLAHEVGQWCAYPDFDVIQKFRGYMQPGNYEIFEHIAARTGVLSMNKEFAWASGRFQLACYKEDIEANLRTPGLAGFQLLDLHDYLGQGTALIGVLDAFWESKGYTSPEEFSKFCGPVVPLAWLKERVFTTDQKLEASIGLAQFGPIELTNALVRWEVIDSKGEVVGACPTNPLRNIPIGYKGQCLDLTMELGSLPAPAEYELVATVESAGQRYENDWNFWLFHEHVDDSRTDDVLVTRVWPDAEKELAAGGKVLFIPPAEDLDPARCPPMKRVPVFWNIQMTVRPPRNPEPRFDAMLGLLCDTSHPALAEFPTDRNCDWQWTPLINGVRSVNLTGTTPELQPIVWAIDDWNRNWKLGVMFECKVGSGRLLVSVINLTDGRGGSELRQLRRSLLDYMGSEEFKPVATFTREQVRALWTRTEPNIRQPARVFDPDLNDGSIPSPENSEP